VHVMNRPGARKASHPASAGTPELVAA